MGSKPPVVVEVELAKVALVETVVDTDAVEVPVELAEVVPSVELVRPVELVVVPSVELDTDVVLAARAVDDVAAVVADADRVVVAPPKVVDAAMPVEVTYVSAVVASEVAVVEAAVVASVVEAAVVASVVEAAVVRVVETDVVEATAVEVDGRGATARGIMMIRATTAASESSVATISET